MAHGARDLITFNCLANFNECKYISCRPGNQGVSQPQSSKCVRVHMRIGLNPFYFIETTACELQYSLLKMGF